MVVPVYYKNAASESTRGGRCGRRWYRHRLSRASALGILRACVAAVGVALGFYWMASVLLAASLRLGSVSFNTPSSYFATDAASSTSCARLKPREALP